MTNMNQYPDDQLPPELEDAFRTVQRQAFAGPPVVPNAAVREYVSADPTLVDATIPADVTQVFDVDQLTPSPASSGPGRRSVFAMAAAALGTVAGKVALTGGVVAAAVVGAHSTGAIDAPLLPEVGNDAAVVAAVDDPNASAPIVSQSSTTSSSTSTTLAPASVIEDVSITRSLKIDVGARTVQLEVIVTGADVSAADATCDAAIAAIDGELSTPSWIGATARALETCDDAYEDILGQAWERTHSLNLDVTADGFDFDFDTDDLDFDLDDFDFDDFDPEDFPFDDFDPEVFPFDGFDPEVFPFGDLESFKDELEKDALDFERFFDEDFDPEELRKKFEDDFAELEAQQRQFAEELRKMLEDGSLDLDGFFDSDLADDLLDEAKDALDDAVDELDDAVDDLDDDIDDIDD